MTDVKAAADERKPLEDGGAATDASTPADSAHSAGTPDEAEPAIEGSLSEDGAAQLSNDASLVGGAAAAVESDEKDGPPRVLAPLVLPPEKPSEEEGGALEATSTGSKGYVEIGAIATPEGTMHATVEMVSPSAALSAVEEAGGDSVAPPPPPSAETGTEATGDAPAPPSEDGSGPPTGGTDPADDADGSDGEGEHATIKEVTESPDKQEAPPTDEKVEQILARIRDKCVTNLMTSIGLH